jgi:BirA family biotin operon repressor/biotin-[acetyl-CoA-carboxylase] ligase
MIIIYDSLPSTQTEAFRLLGEKKFEDGTCIMAHSQTNGRGTHGRVWQSNSNALTFSFIINNKYHPHYFYPFLCAIIMGNIIKKNCSGSLSLAYKWPNDFVFNNKKAGGILIESDGYDHYVIGIGINLNSSPTHDVPTSIGIPIELNPHQIVELFMHDFLQSIRNPQLSFEWIRDEWMKHSYLLNQAIQFQHGNNVYDGIYNGITMAGELIIIPHATMEPINVSQGRILNPYGTY